MNDRSPDDDAEPTATHDAIDAIDDVDAIDDTGRTEDAGPADGAAWPVDLRGVTESVVATRGPNGQWNFAALGLHASGRGEPSDRNADATADPDGRGDGTDPAGGDPDAGAGAVTARTFGNTRTRRNFGREGGGVVQFTADPMEFVDAALSIREGDDPVLTGAAAWVEVRAERIDAGESGGTRWREWRLAPVEGDVRRETVPTINRGFNAVIEATVAASRLGVPAYDDATLRERLTHFAAVVETCGGPAERAAFERLCELTQWRQD